MLRYFFHSLTAVVLTIFPMTVMAAESMKLNPNAVVLFQEMPDPVDRPKEYRGDRLWGMSFCPVNSKKGFAVLCKGKVSYGFRETFLRQRTKLSRKHFDAFRVNGYRYAINWEEPKGKGLYAFTYGTFVANTYWPHDRTWVANFAPGVVVIRSGREGNRAAAIKRAKAMMVQQYGEIAHKMKYEVLKMVSVSCDKKANVLQKNCVIK
ncbi:hypothetical protein F9L33_05245 [Amylibacter sp. SFDW26]|uniref:hypothetical protein n=1 Tax=Amylibacter sp. SFDW26 TaxID=2652722 RepID=UPI0012624584|nr:hypothetical protein [Amylibacter sp. SFDW26]KAB7616159.1 hypothetical protein F9L33_05245 [Amylibacter sp. SFDW26]